MAVPELEELGGREVQAADEPDHDRGSGPRPTTHARLDRAQEEVLLGGRERVEGLQRPHLHGELDPLGQVRSVRPLELGEQLPFEVDDRLALLRRGKGRWAVRRACPRCRFLRRRRAAHLSVEDRDPQGRESGGRYLRRASPEGHHAVAGTPGVPGGIGAIPPAGFTPARAMSSRHSCRQPAGSL